MIRGYARVHTIVPASLSYSRRTLTVLNKSERASLKTSSPVSVVSMSSATLTGPVLTHVMAFCAGSEKKSLERRSVIGRWKSLA